MNASNDPIGEIIDSHWMANHQAILRAMAAPTPRLAMIHWSEARHHQQAAILHAVGSIRDRLVLELSAMHEMSENFPSMTDAIQQAMNITLELDKIGQRPKPPPLNPTSPPQQ